MAKGLLLLTSESSMRLLTNKEGAIRSGEGPMRNVLWLLLTLVFLSATGGGGAAVLYVGGFDVSRTESSGQDGPLASIQSAINAARSGDTVVVQPGKYVENIDFLGKAITVRSKDPENPSIVATTIIDGGKKGSVVTFDSSESAASVLSGFIITNGLADWGGGIYCGLWTVPTVRNNRIVENTALQGGGGIYCAYSITASRNVISFNHANLVGGGIFADSSSWPLLTSNFIINNSAGDSGGGIFCAQFCIGRIINNTVADNSAPVLGGGLYCAFAAPEVWNCIFWGNGDDLYGWGGGYLCVEDTGGENEGTGNIHQNPSFVNRALQDYHLLSSSPCIGRGSTNAPSMPALDYDGETIPFRTAADIGADEFVDFDSDTLPDFWEKKWFGNLTKPAGADSDADQLTNAKELVAGTDPTKPDTDGDKCLDGVEVLAGTDPLDPASFFAISSFFRSASQLTLRWATAPGRWYQLYISNDLKTWSQLGSAIRASGNSLQSTITLAKSIRIRFFKVQVQP